MNGWVIFVTAWICLQTIIKVCKAVKDAVDKKSAMYLFYSAITGSICWGLFMVFALYMGGFYDG